MHKDVAEIVERFQRAAKDPATYARSWKEKNQKDVIGYFCSYAPEEIIMAAGALPFRIFGGSKSRYHWQMPISKRTVAVLYAVLLRMLFPAVLIF